MTEDSVNICVQCPLDVLTQADTTDINRLGHNKWD